MSTKIVTRLAVTAFAQEMERVLGENDFKGGWEGMSTCDLRRKLEEEVHELDDAVELFTAACKLESELEESTIRDIQAHLLHELVDVANVCMMIADSCSDLTKEERRK